MASKATASTAVLTLLLAAVAAAVSTTAGKASQPKPSPWFGPPRMFSKSPTMASVSPSRPSLKSSPPASGTCVTSLLDLSPCLSFFKDTAATAAPAGCCDGLRTIIDTQALCLCHIVDHSLEHAIGVNIPISRAFHLLGDICSLGLPPEVITGCGDKGRVPPLYSCPVPST